MQDPARQNQIRQIKETSYNSLQSKVQDKKNQDKKRKSKTN